MARRYGVVPSELRNLDAEDFQFTLLVAEIGIAEEQKAAQKAMKARRR